MLRNLISVRPARTRTAGALVRALGSGARFTDRRRSRAVAALEMLEGRALLSSLQLVNPSVVAADISVSGSGGLPQHTLDGNAFNAPLGTVSGPAGSNAQTTAFLNYQPNGSDFFMEFSTFSQEAGSAVIRTVSNPVNQPSTDLLTFVINPTGNQKAGDLVNVSIQGTYGNVVGNGQVTYNIDYLTGGGTRQTLISGLNADTNQQLNGARTINFTAAVGQTFQVQMALNATSNSAVNRSVLDLDVRSTDLPNVTDTGGHLNSIVAGHGEVFGLTGDNALWVYNDTTGWTNTGGHAASIAVGTAADGSDEVWADAGGGAIWRYNNGNWFNTGGNLNTIVAGHGQVFGLTGDNALWIYNDTTGWTNTGGHAASIAVGTAAGGSDEVWADAGAGAIWRYSDGAWFNTGGHLNSFVAGHGQVFGLTGDNALWIYNDTTGWANTGGHAASIAVGTAADGSDEVWADAGGGAIWRYNNGNWFNTGGHLNSFVAGQGGVFGLTGDNALWVYNDATDWTNIQVTGIQIAAGTDLAGKNELWFLDPNTKLLRYRA